MPLSALRGRLRVKSRNKHMTIQNKPSLGADIYGSRAVASLKASF